MAMERSSAFKWWPYFGFCLICVVATGIVCQRIVADAIARQAEADRLMASGGNVGPTADSLRAGPALADDKSAPSADGLPESAGDTQSGAGPRQADRVATIATDQDMPAPVAILMAESLPVSIAYDSRVHEVTPVDALTPENRDELIVEATAPPIETPPVVVPPPAVPPAVAPSLEQPEKVVAATPAVDAMVPENSAPLLLAHDQPTPVPPSSPGDDREAIALGRELFMHVWKPDDPLASGDGLGPVFNAASCAQCHFQGAEGGSGSNAHNVKTFEVLPRKVGDSIISGVIHANSTSVGYHDRETIRSVTSLYPEQVRTARRTIPAVRQVDINTPPLWGNGLIDQLTDKQLFEHRHATGTPHGRLRRLPDGRYGRFGWKGQFATLREFVAGACANEIGLSNETAQQMVPNQYRPDVSASHDLTEAQVDAMVKYVASLPAPRQVMPTDNEQRSMAERGRRYFGTIGCTKCHPHNLGDLKGVFSDFQLHSVVDPTKSASSPYYAPGPLVIQPPKKDPSLTEWKTPPLWGVADTAPYWHDGSAPTLREAILKHADEAEPVRENFLKLPEAQQESVIAFLHTLRAPQIAEPPVVADEAVSQTGN